ncbi:hypothetical protein [uncultured Roseobacter sp.]|uniref:hypothetical protein n=1 Tax=uncultured Roseobacter sp. TaxID=114847 RepID=UPI00262AAE51|nr:hypothetical protein [uncultured Roseobacter sp.]
MADETALAAARDSMKWWNRYYHMLLYLHFFLGISGIVIGSLIAADFQTNWKFLEPQFLGILSTVIVGVVSFVQPGRMASVFYDAYWRMRVAILRHKEGQLDPAGLVDAIANGFTAVAEIQPEALIAAERERDRPDETLTEEQQARLVAFREALLAENADTAETEPPREGS